MVGVQEVSLDFTMFDLVAMNLSNRFKCQIDVSHVVDVDNLHHAGSTLINWVHFSTEQCCLLLLLV